MYGRKNFERPSAEERDQRQLRLPEGSTWFQLQKKYLKKVKEMVLQIIELLNYFWYIYKSPSCRALALESHLASKVLISRCLDNNPPGWCWHFPLASLLASSPVTTLQNTGIPKSPSQHSLQFDIPPNRSHGRRSTFHVRWSPIFQTIRSKSCFASKSSTTTTQAKARWPSAIVQCASRVRTTNTMPVGKWFANQLIVHTLYFHSDIRVSTLWTHRQRNGSNGCA